MACPPEEMACATAGAHPSLQIAVWHEGQVASSDGPRETMFAVRGLARVPA